MSNAMTEEEVRAKYGDHFDLAYKLLDDNDSHDLIMIALQSFAESPEDLREFLAEVKRFAEPSADDGSDDDVEKLVEMILEKFGTLHPDALDKLVGAVAKRFVDDSPRRACDHKQLYAHVTVDLVLPVEHNSASEMAAVGSRIYAALEGTELNNYRVRSGIEVSTDQTLAG